MKTHYRNCKKENPKTQNKLLFLDTFNGIFSDFSYMIFMSDRYSQE